MIFEKTLQEFYNILEEYNPVNYERIKPSLPNVEIESYLKMLHIQDDDFHKLYKFKNWANPDVESKCQILNWGCILSLELIVNYWNANKKASHWKNEFIPVVSNNAGEFLLYNNKAGNNYGKLHLFSASLLFVEKPITYYDSLSAMILTTIGVYKQGALHYDKTEDWLDTDVYKYHEVAKKLNPNSDYWKL